jgi:hypothetical protein
MQGVFPGKLHSREVVIAAMKRFDSFWVLYECVIAPPATVLQLMELHFNLNAFVTALNQTITLQLQSSRRLKKCELAGWPLKNIGPQTDGRLT